MQYIQYYNRLEPRDQWTKLPENDGERASKPIGEI